MERERQTSSTPEENHRWPQTYTESEVWIPVLLRGALGNCLVNGFSPWKSAVLSNPYLGLSVFICGGIEFSQPRGGVLQGRGERSAVRSYTELLSVFKGVADFGFWRMMDAREDWIRAWYGKT
jgi:hypothetical protein